MPGVPTFFKCISIMSVMKKSFCVGEMKKKKKQKCQFSQMGSQNTQILACLGSKMLKFYPKEGQSLKGVWGFISKKTFCLLSVLVVSEGSVQGMGMGSVFC